MFIKSFHRLVGLLCLFSLHSFAGVYPLHNRAQCAGENTAACFSKGEGFSALDWISVSSGKDRQLVAIINDIWVQDIQNATDFFASHGDTWIHQKTFCVGLYPFQEFNAYSHPWGYIGVDPSVRELMNEKLEKRSMASMQQVLFHEFAHQFQFAHGDRFATDRNVRRSELVADCIGGTINAGLGIERYGLQLWSKLEEGVKEAALAVGDYNFESDQHHGLPLERYVATRMGFDLAKEKAQTRFSGLTSREVLKVCEDRIARTYAQ